MLTPLPPPTQSLPVNTEVLDALYNIKTTPFDNSFLSRLHGSRDFVPPGLVAVDWETKTPWMNVMANIREHYLFAQSVQTFFYCILANTESSPEREPPIEDVSPITYSTLHPYQLPQIHDLLERSFWTGINGEQPIFSSKFFIQFNSSFQSAILLIIGLKKLLW